MISKQLNSSQVTFVMWLEMELEKLHVQAQANQTK